MRQKEPNANPLNGGEALNLLSTPYFVLLTWYSGHRHTEARADPIDKDQSSSSRRVIRRVFSRSLCDLSHPRENGSPKHITTSPPGPKPCIYCWVSGCSRAWPAAVVKVSFAKLRIDPVLAFSRMPSSRPVRVQTV